jgi:hypothetical protein
MKNWARSVKRDARYKSSISKLQAKKNRAAPYGAAAKGYYEGGRSMKNCGYAHLKNRFDSRSRPTRMTIAYLFNLGRGVEEVREMIRSDIHRFSELGASGYVSDLIEVSNFFEAEFSDP